MTTSYTCDQFAERLADLLERDVDEATRGSMEAHALACAECAPLLADLRRLRVDAANLPELAPSRDLWAGIAARIETPVVELNGGGTVERWSGGTRRRTYTWMGLAAAGLVAITASVTRELTKRAMDATPPVRIASTARTAPNTAQGRGVEPVAADHSPSRPDTVPPFHGFTVPATERSSAPARTTRLASSRPTAEQTYDAEIAQLRAVLAVRRSQLDSTTIAVVEKNLKIIDDAIVQCRAALRKDPASRYLLESLNDALDTKVQLLRTAVALPSRS